MNFLPQENNLKYQFGKPLIFSYKVMNTIHNNVYLLFIQGQVKKEVVNQLDSIFMYSIRICEVEVDSYQGFFRSIHDRG